MTTLGQWDLILSAGIDTLPDGVGGPTEVVRIALTGMRDRARDLAAADAGAYLPSNAGAARRLWRVPWHAGDLIVAAHSEVDAAHQADSWLRAHPHLISGDMPDWKGAEPIDSPVYQVVSEAEQVRVAEVQGARLTRVIMDTLTDMGAEPDGELREKVAAAIRRAVTAG